MSLHIESTEEVLAELKRQRAKSLAAAVTVSFLGVALMGLLLYLVNIITAIPEDPAVTVYPTDERKGEDPINPEITRPQRPSSSQRNSEVKIVASTAATDVPINNPEIDVEIPSDSFSDGRNSETTSALTTERDQADTLRTTLLFPSAAT